MSVSWTEEEIAALIDGALEEPRASEIQAILAEDPAAQAVADDIHRTNALVQAAYADILEEPVPAALTATVLGEPGKVSALRPRAQPRPRPQWLPMAMAAGLALAIGVTGGVWLTNAPSATQIAVGGLAPDHPLFAALETLPSGQTSPDGLVPMLSFVDSTGRYCREFESLDTLPGELEIGIACRNGAKDWHVEIVVTAPHIEPGPAGFVPASGPGGDALETMLDALGASAPLSPDEEKEILQRGWTPR